MHEKETIKQILTEIKPTVDFETTKAIVDDGALDSLEFLSLVSRLSEQFCIEVNANDIVPENFNSIDSIEAMVKRLQA